MNMPFPLLTRGLHKYRGIPLSQSQSVLSIVISTQPLTFRDMTVLWPQLPPYWNMLLQQISNGSPRRLIFHLSEWFVLSHGCQLLAESNFQNLMAEPLNIPCCMDHSWHKLSRYPLPSSGSFDPHKHAWYVGARTNHHPYPYHDLLLV